MTPCRSATHWLDITESGVSRYFHILRHVIMQNMEIAWEIAGAWYNPYKGFVNNFRESTHLAPKELLQWCSYVHRVIQAVVFT